MFVSFFGWLLSFANAAMPRHVGAITPVEQSIDGIGIFLLLVAVAGIRIVQSRILVIRIVTIGTDRSGIGKDKCPEGTGSSRTIITATATAIVIAIDIAIVSFSSRLFGFETRQDPNPHSVEAKLGAEFLVCWLLQSGVQAKRHQHR